MRFTKMQGLGNDYVYLDCTKESPEDLPGLAVALSDRHFGVGGDGIICICPSDRADFRMRMFNADGSEGEMCGNGIRCVGKFVYDKGLTRETCVTVETLAGVKRLQLTVEKGAVTAAAVDMGVPAAQAVRTLQIMGRPYQIHPVSMGNPHAVIFVDRVEEADVSALGPRVENHPIFPGRTNVEFVAIEDPQHLSMRVWERGSGETLACGTGACAALAAAVLEGKAAREAEVRLRGGTLSIRWEESDGHIYMTGPAVTVFEGDWQPGEN